MPEAGRIAGSALGLLFQLNRETWARVSADTSLPQSVKTAVYMHLTYPWRPTFLAVAVAPLRKGLLAFLGRAVFELGGAVYFNPSDGFWRSHAESLHAPVGAGCEPVAHARMLTVESQEASFAYAMVMKDGSIALADRADFDEECRFLSHGRASA